MRYRHDGRVVPTTDDEWSLYREMLKQGWGPRRKRPDRLAVTYKTCPQCGEPFAYGAGVRSKGSGTVEQVQLCSLECEVGWTALMYARQALLRRIIVLHHHRRVVAHLEEHGWVVKRRQEVRRALRVQDDGARKDTYIWRYSGQNLHCTHPNVKGWMWVYTGLNCPKDVHVWFRPVRLDSPFIYTFHCMSQSRVGKIKGRWLARAKDGTCICVTCQALEKIVSYEQAQFVYRGLTDTRIGRLAHLDTGGVRIVEGAGEDEYGKDLHQRAKAREFHSKRRDASRQLDYKPRTRRTLQNLLNEWQDHTGDGRKRPKRRHPGGQGTGLRDYGPVGDGSHGEVDAVTDCPDNGEGQVVVPTQVVD